MSIKTFQVILAAYRNMSDTDSAVLTKPLPDYLVGKELGQMKLVHKIKQGIFLRKKFYYILDSDNKENIKSSGMDSSKLDYTSFIKLLNGQSIEIERTNFNVEWKTLNINVVSSNIIIQGLKGEIKTLYNTQDVNYKFISFPIKYSITIHPLYPYEIKDNEKIKLNLDQVEMESDLFILFSKFEIILFLISLLLLIIFIFLYIFIYK